MSETGNSSPEFTPRDISTNAFKSDVTGPEIDIATIASADPEAYGTKDTRHRYDHDLIADRYDALVRADAFFQQGKYTAAISELKWVLADMDHAGDLNQAREFEIRMAMELCYDVSARIKGSVALAEVVPLPDAPSVGVALTPQPVNEPLAS